MSNEDDKIREFEEKLLTKLNQEESWISKHPGWVTVIGGLLFIALMVAVVKGCGH